jgi:dolichyl-phosphate beta-glucosyltransferase
MKISLVIPIYNYEKRLNEKVDFLLNYFGESRHDHEIIFVNDGSTDGSMNILSQLKAPFKVIDLVTNHGKGAAVKRGISVASGDYIFFTDIDIPYHLSALDTAINHLKSGYEVVLGSRELPDSMSACTRPTDRRLGSKVFSFLANFILIDKVQDTQCGFKGFKKHAAKSIFKDVKSDGFIFDVELIYHAQKQGLKTILIPVHLIDDSESSVRFVRDSVVMAYHLLKLYIRLNTGAFYQFVRYGFMGIYNTLLNIAIFNLFIISSGISKGSWINVFSLISFVLVITQAFFINAYWVFRKKEAIKLRNYRNFFMVSGLVALVNIGIIHVLVNIIGAPYGLNEQVWANLAMISTVFVSVVCNYIGYKVIVFK